MAWGAALDEVARLNASPVQQDQAFCEYCGGNDEEPQDHCMDCTRPAQQVSVPDGYALVPIEPTPEMIKAALDKPCFDPLGDPLPWSHITRTSYAAMLAAAPAAPAADGWIPVSERLPDIGSTVIAYYLNSYGKGRTIRAQHVEAWTIEAEDVADVDTDCVEYSEQDDCYYLLQGWYECIDNWDEYYRVAVTGGPITHWMPLPAAPSANSAQGVV
jgi:hypothetical protein